MPQDGKWAHTFDADIQYNTQFGKVILVHSST